MPYDPDGFISGPNDYRRQAAQKPTRADYAAAMRDPVVRGFAVAAFGALAAFGVVLATDTRSPALPEFKPQELALNGQAASPTRVFIPVVYK